MHAPPPVQRPLGLTGLTTSALGLGAGHIGGDADEQQVEALLQGALDQGVTFLDTARAYGRAEERIGRYLSGRRGEFVLSTKGGYGAQGAQDWTAAAITLGIEQALRRLRTEYIDVFHLHSCPLPVLAQQDILEALRPMRCWPASPTAMSRAGCCAR